jgi:hypothetical protein
MTVGATKISNPFHCETGVLHKGETVKVVKVTTVKHGKILALSVETLPHSLTRGIGAYEHQSIEVGRVALGFESSDKDALVGQWLRMFDAPAPDQLGNTSSMVVVKEVKLGMTYAEVEQALGVPQTRIDLGGKVLYKYKDITVEFREGKVADVR